VYAAIKSLTCGTEYHYRLITENSFGISYGEDFTFISGLPPTVATIPVSGITDTTAISGGNVIDDQGLAVTDRGVIWWTDAIARCKCRVPPRTHDGSGTGNFTSYLNLKVFQIRTTTYYVEAYATNSVGTGVGEVISFTTSK
jgi:hypothetical protein